MIPLIFFLIPLLTMTADNGTTIPVFVTDDMETWCDTQGNHAACVVSFGPFTTIITTNPFHKDNQCNTQIEHEMYHVNGIMYERDIPNNCQLPIPDYMKDYLNRSGQ